MTCKWCEKDDCQLGGICEMCEDPIGECIGPLNSPISVEWDSDGKPTRWEHLPRKKQQWICPDCLIAEGHSCKRTGGRTVPIKDREDGAIICSVCRKILIPA